MRAGSVATVGASSAMATIAAMITAPTSVILRRDSKTSQRGAVRAETRASGSSIACAAGSVTAMGIPGDRSLVLHARIDYQIREVNGEVHEHGDAGDAEHDALDHRVVASQDRRDDEPSEARDVEDRLDDDGARQQDGEADADDGDGRDQRVAEGVLVDDDPLAEALRATGH